MWDAEGMLPGVDNLANDLIETYPMFDLGKHDRTVATHLSSVTLHDLQIRADGLSKIDLIDHEQIRLSDPGPTFAWNLVPARNVDHLNGEIG